MSAFILYWAAQVASEIRSAIQTRGAGGLAGATAAGLFRGPVMFVGSLPWPFAVSWLSHAQQAGRKPFSQSGPDLRLPWGC